MAKVKGTIFPVSGTVGEYVFVDSKKYGHHIRRRVQAGSKKNEPALKKAYKRTKFLNHFASGINSVIAAVGEGHKDGKFYPGLLKRFRTQPLDKKYLLLSTLKGMDVNPRHHLGTLKGREEATVKASKNGISVNITVTSAPGKESPNFDSYCYGVVLLTWSKTSDEPKYEEKYTVWLPLNRAKPAFEFSFPKKPGMVHWMLCLRKQFGYKGEVFSTASQAMRIIEVGTYDKTEELLLNKQKAEGSKRKSSSLKPEKKIVRIEPIKKHLITNTEQNITLPDNPANDFSDANTRWKSASVSASSRSAPFGSGEPTEQFHPV
jgi:hypothetical protein